MAATGRGQDCASTRGQEATNAMGATLEYVESPARPANRARHLVIVADNPLIVEAIRIAFRQRPDFQLVGYTHPRALPARPLRHARPDVILLDDTDQSQRTLKLIRLLRSEHDNVAVIVLSFQLDPGWLDEVFGAGATAVISKATRTPALATLVRETLDGHIVHPRPSGPPTGTQTPATAQDLPLTNREVEILKLVASGSTNGDVARRLWVTEQTVKFHLRNIYRKIEVANRTEASHFAHLTGLVETGQATLEVA
jgi:DNA-binding NarL/FixJ family response regulator